MSDTISRAKAIAVIRKNHYRLQGKGMTEEVLIADLEALPSAERTGQWVAPYVLKDGSIGACCSQCGAFLPTTCDYNNYCPNCGSYNGGEK